MGKVLTGNASGRISGWIDDSLWRRRRRRRNPTKFRWHSPSCPAFPPFPPGSPPTPSTRISAHPHHNRTHATSTTKSPRIRAKCDRTRRADTHLEHGGATVNFELQLRFGVPFRPHIAREMHAWRHGTNWWRRVDSMKDETRIALSSARLRSAATDTREIPVAPRSVSRRQRGTNLCTISVRDSWNLRMSTFALYEQ